MFGLGPRLHSQGFSSLKIFVRPAHLRYYLSLILSGFVGRAYHIHQRARNARLLSIGDLGKLVRGLNFPQQEGSFASLAVSVHCTRLRQPLC